MEGTRFEKVSLKQFLESYDDSYKNIVKEDINKVYADLKLPRRATLGSAGYDFYAPFDIVLAPGETLKVPTGIRAFITPGWFLALFPRSGLGFKFRLQLNNTVGIIDSDYVNSDNEGHIFVKITNDSNENKTLVVKKGEGLVQGIFMPFGFTEDDDASEVRNGGFGSTTK